jgi:hypothetical protein
MRSLATLALAATLVASATFVAPSTAHARLFWQTYGATVPGPDGCGCAWNLDSDYFVPRTCDSCRYDLFSACKTSHSISPACKYLHPVYGGYCTIYGPAHYKWRDCLYKERCGCTPLKCTYGKWHLEKCRKHCGALKHEACGWCAREGCGGCGNGACTSGCAVAAGCNACAIAGASGCAACGEFSGDGLANLEPFGGQTLGEVAALPAGMMRAGGGQAMPMGMPAAASQTTPAMQSLPNTGGSPFSIPGIFGG